MKLKKLKKKLVFLTSFLILETTKYLNKNTILFKNYEIINNIKKFYY